MAQLEFSEEGGHLADVEWLILHWQSSDRSLAKYCTHLLGIDETGIDVTVAMQE